VCAIKCLRLTDAIIGGTKNYYECVSNCTVREKCVIEYQNQPNHSIIFFNLIKKSNKKEIVMKS
jgi:hypothetical protein